ncbi:transcription factor bHLH52-like [Lycium ferocissimum]|uniref:transcription factor bHLH52-like n=1 Tax=Lycium ferocissimum TaxID=112874 RepID=UPI0028166769|nr:transcription factor bHLH52-like [Lycium ferocissimum]
MEMQLPPELLFDFNYDDELSFYNNPEDCYFDPFFDTNEFILPVESTHNSSFMPEYCDFESTPKQQKFFQDNCLPDTIITSHNSSFMPQYSICDSKPKQQNNCLPNIITSSHNSSLMPEYSLIESTPKRQKVFQDNCLLPDIITSSNNLFNGFVPNPPIFQDFASFSIPEIPMPVFSSGCCNNNAEVVVKKSNNEKKMSAQSIAARQRRKKITEKTQELGKLIPGGHRMNTAEMLQATFKYIKFLQAQAGLLEFMGSYQEDEKSIQTTDLHKLVGSSLIQEKLYSSEKCLVPKVFLEALENNHEVQNSLGFEIEEVKPLIR